MGDDLLRRVIGGEQAAFDELTRKYSSFVMACIHKTLQQYSFSPVREDVEDLHNGLFVSLFENDFRRIRQYQGRASFETYLKVIVMRQVVDFLRRQRNHISIDSDCVNPADLRDHSPYADSVLQSSEDDRTLAAAIGGLAPAERLLLKLAVHKGLSANKVCKIMNISMVAYYNRKSRIIRKLKDLCEKGVPGSSIKARR